MSQHYSITQLMSVCRNSLQAIVPMFQSVQLGWGEKGDMEWDEAAAALYYALVESAIKEAFNDWGSHRPMIRYDVHTGTYANFSFVGTVLSGRTYAFVSFQANEKSFFETCNLAEVNDRGAAIATSRVPFNSIAFLFFPRRAHGDLEPGRDSVTF